MKIVFLARRFHPHIGGVEKHVLELSKNLLKKGHEIVVITESIKNVPEKENVNGINIVRINTGNDSWFKKFRAWRQIWKNQNYFKEADVIHCHDVFYWYLPLKFIFLNKRVYTTFHGYETRFPPSTKSIVVRKISEKLSNGNICVGEYIKKWYHTNPDFVIYGGINNYKTIDKDVSKKNILKIILLGRLEKDIGINIYAKSLELVKRKKFKFKFIAYGEGALRNTLLNYGKVFDFISEVNKVIQESDVVFASSYLLMLEALVHKKIVIAVYDNPLKNDYLTMSPFVNYIYICDSASEVARVLETIKRDNWKSRTMLDKGFDWACKQTWESVAEIYLLLWKK